MLHLQATDAVLREDGEHAGVRVRDDPHGALGLGAHRVVVAHHHSPLEAGGLLQRLAAEAEPLAEQRHDGAGHGGGVRVPADDLGAARRRDAPRVGARGPERDLDGVAPARGAGPVQVEVGEVVHPAVHGAAVVRGALRGGELVEGARGGEEPVGEAGGDEVVVVDEVEETPLARRPRRGLGGERRGEGEVDDGDGDAGWSERDGGVGVGVAEDVRDGGDTGLDEAADAGACLVEGLDEGGAVRCRRGGGGGRHGRRLAGLMTNWIAFVWIETDNRTELRERKKSRENCIYTRNIWMVAAAVVLVVMMKLLGGMGLRASGIVGGGMG